jgi:protoheme IX farnesyltransferase
VQAAGEQPDRVHRGDRHVPRQPGWPPAGLMLAATVGIALVAGAAAAINCLVERTIDARMARTRARPLPGPDQPRRDPRPRLPHRRRRAVAAAHGGQSAHHVAHAGHLPGLRHRHTVILKPATPMNIVIGGASGRCRRCSAGPR